MSQLEYRTAVATGLLEGLKCPRKCLAASTPELPLCLTELAFPEPIPDKGRADCKVCSDRSAKKRHQTGYRCKLCHTPLHLYPCFKRYHTLKKTDVMSTLALPNSLLLSIALPSTCIYTSLYPSHFVYVPHYLPLHSILCMYPTLSHCTLSFPLCLCTSLSPTALYEYRG